jgi:hypothetical protein
MVSQVYEVQRGLLATASQVKEELREIQDVMALPDLLDLLVFLDKMVFQDYQEPKEMMDFQDYQGKKETVV